MVLFNYGSKEITAKVVFYGPGLGGKTTNLQYIHEKMNPETRGKLLSLATESDRTLFFDFLPVNLGEIRGFTVRFQLYTVPGQVYYNATRRLVLKGADAVVFVADSQNEMMEKNIESLENMKENLIANGLDPATIPLVIQYNKRDLPNIMEVEELNRRLNYRNVSYNSAIAVTGEGVLETFKLITKGLMQSLRKKHDIKEFQETGGQDSKTTPKAQTAPEIPQPIETGNDTMGRDRPVLVQPSTTGSSNPSVESLATAVQGMQRHIQNMEEQLQALLDKDVTIHDLLQQISERLVNENGGNGFHDKVIEEPIIIEEETKPKKKGFFWNR